ncbi:hypothetical protein DXG01_010886 [Tephrocybe rancida]|nr:hypothetical protein DXG01_010886 [Tephrocybe rancida]
MCWTGTLSKSRGVGLLRSTTSRCQIYPSPASPPHLISSPTSKTNSPSEKVLERAKTAKSSLEAYLGTLNIQHTHPTFPANEALFPFESRGEKLDIKILSFEKQITGLSQAIVEEHMKLAGPPRNEKLGVRVGVGVFAAEEGEVAVVLVYAVRSATWSAAYDIRVVTQTKQKLITLIYKAGITQDTGEKMKSFGGPRAMTESSAWLRSAEEYDINVADERSPRSELESMEHRGLDKGDVTATFNAPGAITVPSDGVRHSVTVTKLELDAKMEWVAVPQVDAKAHLKAKINNTFVYTLLPATASVYVDGSFISRSDAPLVSPLENFDCPLGLDPSIRVTYHPRERKVSQAGFVYSKSSIYTLTTRITIHNIKSTPIENLSPGTVPRFRERADHY